MKGFNLSALAVRERAITLFTIVALVAIGVFSYLSLGRAEDPPFTVKTLTVIAAWPCATAREMQDLVADPMEKRMQELQWYNRVETYTRPGLAALMVTLKDTTPPRDVPEQFFQARKKLGDTAHLLPAGVIGPFINDEYSDVDFAVYALEGHGLPERALTRVAESLRQRILHVPGVKKVDIMGRAARADLRRIRLRPPRQPGSLATRRFRCTVQAERRDAGRFDRHQRSTGVHAAGRRAG
jgi:multidrug efflux pump subunit AcrB